MGRPAEENRLQSLVMKTTGGLGIGVVAILCFAGIARAQPAHVTAQLVADRSELAPGQPFYLGVVLHMDPGWHVYWINPGDSGVATRVKWHLPAGFTAGPLMFPTPQRILLPGNILNYAYEDSVMLASQITPPKTLPANFSGTFSADVSWLVCSNVCVLGKAKLSLAWPVSGDALSNVAPAVFQNWRSLVPIPARQCNLITDYRVNSGPANIDKSQQITLTVDWTSLPQGIDFFPGISNAYNVTDISYQNKLKQTVIAFTLTPLAGQDRPDEFLDTVVAYQDSNDSDRRHGAIISIQLPKLKLLQ